MQTSSKIAPLRYKHNQPSLEERIRRQKSGKSSGDESEDAASNAKKSVPPNRYAGCARWMYAAYACLFGAFSIAFVVMVIVVNASSVRLLTMTASLSTAAINALIALMLAYAYPDADGAGCLPQTVWLVGPMSAYADKFRADYDLNHNRLRWCDYAVTGATLAYVRYSLVRVTEPAVLLPVGLCYFAVYGCYYLREISNRRVWVVVATCVWLSQQLPLLIIFPAGDATAILLVIAATAMFFVNAFLNWMAPFESRDVIFLVVNGVYRIVVVWVAFFSVVDESV